MDRRLKSEITQGELSDLGRIEHAIGVFNQYNRDWLISRLTSTLARLLTGIMNQTVEVHFIVIEGVAEEEDDQQEEIVEQASIHEQPAVLTLQAVYQSIYDEIVQPDQVIVFPGYFLRYIPLLGVELAWLYIGFRQAAYEAGAAKRPGKKFGAPARKIARYAGMSPRSFMLPVGLAHSIFATTRAESRGIICLIFTRGVFLIMSRMFIRLVFSLPI